MAEPTIFNQPPPPLLLLPSSSSLQKVNFQKPYSVGNPNPLLFLLKTKFSCPPKNCHPHPHPIPHSSVHGDWSLSTRYPSPRQKNCMECSPVNSTNFRIFISKVRKLYIKLRNSEAKLANMFLRWATNFFSVVISIWASLPLRTEAQIFLLYSKGLQPHIVLLSIFILFFFIFFFHKVKEFTAGLISWYISVSINNMLVSIWCIKGQLAITLIRDSET